MKTTQHLLVLLLICFMQMFGAAQAEETKLIPYESTILHPSKKTTIAEQVSERVKMTFGSDIETVCPEGVSKFDINSAPGGFEYSFAGTLFVNNKQFVVCEVFRGTLEQLKQVIALRNEIPEGSDSLAVAEVENPVFDLDTGLEIRKPRIITEDEVIAETTTPIVEKWYTYDDVMAEKAELEKQQADAEAVAQAEPPVEEIRPAVVVAQQPTVANVTPVVETVVEEIQPVATTVVTESIPETAVTTFTPRPKPPMYECVIDVTDQMTIRNVNDDEDSFHPITKAESEFIVMNPRSVKMIRPKFNCITQPNGKVVLREMGSLPSVEYREATDAELKYIQANVGKRPDLVTMAKIAAVPNPPFNYEIFFFVVCGLIVPSGLYRFGREVLYDDVTDRMWEAAGLIMDDSGCIPIGELPQPKVVADKVTLAPPVLNSLPKPEGNGSRPLALVADLSKIDQANPNPFAKQPDRDKKAVLKALLQQDPVENHGEILTPEKQPPIVPNMRNVGELKRLAETAPKVLIVFPKRAAKVGASVVAPPQRPVRLKRSSENQFLKTAIPVAA